METLGRGQRQTMLDLKNHSRTKYAAGPRMAFPLRRALPLAPKSMPSLLSSGTLTGATHRTGRGRSPFCSVALPCDSCHLPPPIPGPEPSFETHRLLGKLSGG